jgi:outer membrane protein OmpA-like peptidoglycan-associated protein
VPVPAPAAAPRAQAIVFAPISAAGLGAGPIDLAAAASSGLGISYASTTPEVCKVSPNGLVTAVGTGMCTIVASQGGNGQWSAAPDSRESFGVTAPPLPAPTTVPTTTVAGKTTQSTLGGIPADATVAVDGDVHIAGVAAVHVDGTRVVVTPTKTFSGVVHVPVVVMEGGRSVETMVSVVVRPAAPTAIAVTPHSNSASSISWKPSASATGYVVRVDGRVVCRTQTTTCDVRALLSPSAHVIVTSTGNAGTHSDDAPAAYAPDHPVLIAIVHFSTDSSTLETTAKNILNGAQSKIAKGGFTHAMLTCHTDSAGSLVYNMALSAARCAAVADFVKRQLGISHVTYNEAAFAFLHPAAPNSTPRGMAKNRRVEVYVK